MNVRRIAVTGGPGGGKTTVWRALTGAHPDLLVPVPEVATLLFRHVFPHVQNARERCAVQRAIYHVQQELETVHESRARPHQLLLCDRGSCDGAAYWPDGYDAFFAAMGTHFDQQLARYDAVLFLETAAVGGYSIREGNDVRTENLAGAVEINHRLHQVWSRHPRFCHVPHERDFAHKITTACAALDTLLGC